MGKEIGSLRVRGRRLRVSQTFLAIDISRFIPVEEFRARMEQRVAEVKSAAPAPGYDEVLVAGDPEWRTERERERHGIPVHDVTWERLLQIAERLSVPVPVRC